MKEDSKISYDISTDPIQKEVLNVYCDESCHLEKDGIECMGWGAFIFPESESKNFKEQINELKAKHKLSKDFEIKWNKISIGKIKFYLELVDIYFDNSKLGFRSLIVSEKSKLDHQRFGNTHNTFYYRMYFHLLNKILDEQSVINIYLDKKDSVGSFKVSKLHEVLCNNAYDFEREILNNVQIDSSHKSIGIQMADFLLGAVTYANRKLNSKEDKLINEGKAKVIERIKEQSGRTLTRTTLISEYKMNVFLWEMQ